LTILLNKLILLVYPKINRKSRKLSTTLIINQNKLMAASKHDEIANKLAKKFNTEYKSDKGIDLVLRDRVIEVETKKASLSQGIGQVVRSQKARYLAVNKINIDNALEETKGTGIGVMNEAGRIIKKASRKNG